MGYWEGAELEGGQSGVGNLQPCQNASPADLCSPSAGDCQQWEKFSGQEQREEQGSRGKRGKAGLWHNNGTGEAGKSTPASPPPPPLGGGNPGLLSGSNSAGEELASMLGACWNAIFGHCLKCMLAVETRIHPPPPVHVSGDGA